MQLLRLHKNAVLLELHPTRGRARGIEPAPGAEGDVLLARGGDRCHLGEGRREQELLHARFVAFAQGYPLAALLEVRVVLHPLELLLAGPARELLGALREPEGAGVADHFAGEEQVPVGECCGHPGVKVLSIP